MVQVSPRNGCCPFGNKLLMFVLSPRDPQNTVRSWSNLLVNDKIKFTMSQFFNIALVSCALKVQLWNSHHHSAFSWRGIIQKSYFIVPEEGGILRFYFFILFSAVLIQQHILTNAEFVLCNSYAIYITFPIEWVWRRGFNHSFVVKRIWVVLLKILYSHTAEAVISDLLPWHTLEHLWDRPFVLL